MLTTDYIGEAARRRAAKTEAQRKRRADMSSKQREAINEARRKRRAKMTPERLAEMRKTNCEAERKRRANMTPEQLEIVRAKNVACGKLRLALMAEAECENKSTNVPGRKRRGAMLSLSEMRKAKSEAARKRRANMTPEQLEIVRAKDAALQREKRWALSFEQVRGGEERDKIRAAYLEKKRRRFDAMSDEDRNKQRAADTKRIQERSAIRKIKDKLENNTTAQRIQRIISKTCRITEKKPKYESALNFIKNSLLEIGNLHIEVGDLKRQLKQTVSEAVTNVIKYGRIKKQTSAVGFRSLTYVQISLPLEPDDIQHQLSTLENQTDPLLLQSGQECQPGGVSPTGDKTNEKIQFNDIHNEIFEVCVHDSPAACEETSQEKNKSKKVGCSICSKKFGTSLGLTIHLKEHTADGNECKCSVCPEVFLNYNLMTTHYLQVHSFQSSTIFADNEVETEETDEEIDRVLYQIGYLYSRKCLICFKRMDKLRVGLPTYSQHVISNHSDNKELLKHFTYICSQCDKPHLMMRSLESHWKTFCYEKWRNQSGNNNDEIVCENCGLKFSNEKSLSSHVKIFHAGTGKKEAVCERCGNQFKNESSLNGHIALVHEGEYKFTCEQCGKKFKTSGNLKSHTQKIHLGEKPYVCKFCTKRFGCSLSLEYHLNTHTGEKPYKCKKCDKSYAAKNSLTAHEGVHGGFNCKMCGDSFTNYMDWCHHRKHYNHHSRDIGKNGINEKTLQNNKNCDICEKTFKSYSALYTHKRTVHGNKKYVCDICGKTYKTSLALTCHKYSHDDLKRFGCSFCGQKFRQMTNFYHHRKLAHVKEDARLVKLIPDNNLSSSAILTKSTSLSNPESDLAIKQPISQQQLSNTMQTLHETPQANNVFQLTEECNVSNWNVEADGAYFSPEIEDYSSDRDFVNEDNADENDLPQFHIAELRNVNVENETYFSVPENVQDSSLSNKRTIFEATTTTDHQSVSSSGFIDFSKANVPSAGLSLYFHDESNTEVTKAKLVSDGNIIDLNQRQHEVFVEDSEDHSFLAKLSNLDLVKLKTEPVGVDDMDDMEEDDEAISSQLWFSDAISDGENEPQTYNPEINHFRICVNNGVDFPRNICSPHLVVKLTRLLEYQCVPCDKTIFAISQRKIRQHSRTHRTNLPIGKLNQLKSEKVSKKGQKKRIFDCGYCERKNLSCSQIIAHCSKEHPGKEPLKCKLCPKIFHRAKEFYKHNKNVHNKKVQKPAAQSKSEELSLPKKKKKKKKSETVSGQKKRIFGCGYCERENLSCSQIIAHCSKAHPGKEPLKCKLCPKIFHRAKGFYKHSKNVHNKNFQKPAAQSKSEEVSHPKKKKKKKSDKRDGNIGIFDCLYCEKKSLTSKQMIVHCAEEHPGGKKPFRCKKCPKMFSNMDLLYSHHRRHRLKELKDASAKKECLCETCGKAFHTLHDVRSHNRTVHKLKKFICDVCSLPCRSKYYLENHKLRHLGMKPHLCDECGKRFVTERELKDHVNVVHKKLKRRNKYKNKYEKTSDTHPFSCKLCPYIFKKESALTSHLQLHDPQRKHSCDECGLRFKFYANVLLHKEYKHKKKGKNCIQVSSADT